MKADPSKDAVVATKGLLEWDLTGTRICSPDKPLDLDPLAKVYFAFNV